MKYRGRAERLAPSTLRGAFTRPRRYRSGMFEIRHQGSLKAALLVAGAVVASFFSLAAPSAQADPTEFQRFKATLNGKSGTDSRPRPVEVTLHTWQEAFGDPPSFLENPPYAMLFVHIYLPRAVKLDTRRSPGCPEKRIIDDPSRCPKGSEIGRTGEAAGYARPVNAPAGVGAYVSLTNRIFVIKEARNTLAVRVKTPLTTGVMRAVVRPARGTERRNWGQVVDFTIPIGLVQPAPGVMSQLTNFIGVLRRATAGGRPVLGLGACPADRRLNFGFMADYNRNLETGDQGLGTSSSANGRFSINVRSPITESIIACPAR